jgi:hypothetical protein
MNDTIPMNEATRSYCHTAIRAVVALGYTHEAAQVAAVKLFTTPARGYAGRIVGSAIGALSFKEIVHAIADSIP